MRRLACVDVPAPALQILRRRHPEWRGAPLVVIDEDRPQGRVLFADRLARRHGVRPGLRYAQALSLARGLRAGVVTPLQIDTAVSELTERLRAHTPEVEPSSSEPGVFWLDAGGLPHLSPAAFGHAILEDLRRAGWCAHVAVGFDRFATYALARAHPGVTVPRTPSDERVRSGAVPLSLLGLDPGLRDALLALGVEDVAAFRRLPPHGLRARFGEEAARLHRLARGVARRPLDPAPPSEPLRASVDFDASEHTSDAPTLLARLGPVLDDLRRRLAARGRALAALRLRLRLEHGLVVEQRLQLAEPTLDPALPRELLRLRLETCTLERELEGFDLEVEPAPPARRQPMLFAASPARDPRAAARALARLRAALGEEAVVRAELREGHLPEACFAWRPFTDLRLPTPPPASRPTLVRRLLSRPRPVGRPRRTADGWIEGSLTCGPLRTLLGPFVFEGGWWRRPLHREYAFAETARGDLLWLYLDRNRRRWLLQGTVD